MPLAVAEAVELPVAVAMELQPSREMTEGVGSEASATDAPLSHVHGGSWVLEASGLRDSVADPETPDNPRVSRMSSDLRIATDEDVELEIKEEHEKDAKAGVKRPENYVKLGGKLPFRIARVAEDLTPVWLTTVLRFKKILPMLRTDRVSKIVLVTAFYHLRRSCILADSVFESIQAGATMSVLDSIHFGSTCSLRSFARYHRRLRQHVHVSP